MPSRRGSGDEGAQNPGMESVMADREGGATLIEVLVSAALVIVAVLVAGSLIVHSVKLDRSLMSALRQPDGDLAIAWIRRDVHAATALIDRSVVWTEQQLVLRAFGGAETVYTIRDGVLVRQGLDPAGAEISRRVVMRRVDGFCWRGLTPRLLEVELTLPPRENRVQASDGDRLAEGRQETFRALVALRARGAGSW